MRVGAVIVAGGSGSRLGSSTPKQFLPIRGGNTMLQRAVDAFDGHPLIRECVVVLPAHHAPALVARAAGPDSERRFERFATVTGGRRRQDSVENGVRALSSDVDVVLVHDAARPFVTRALIDRVIAAADAHDAVVPGLAAVDTVKHVDAAMHVRASLPRQEIWLAQTPQAARRQALLDAFERNRAAGDSDVTDEGMLIERAGGTVTVIAGDKANVKITTADDLTRANGMAPRVGTGYDLHRLAEGRPLVLAGVTMPFDKGPVSHSDGDVLCHALTDAILGAAGAGDIGRHFPNTDASWKDAAGLDLLARAVDIVRAAGFAMASADVTVVLERPKLAPHVDAMRDNVARVLGIDAGAVGLKGKTNEGVDAVGRGEAIAAHAVAVIVPIGAAS